MIVIGFAEGLDTAVKFSTLDLVVDVRDITTFCDKLSSSIRDGMSSTTCPLPLSGDPSGAIGNSYCVVLENGWDCNLSLGAVSWGREDDLKPMWAALCFSEGEKEAVLSFLASQTERPAVGPPYGGEHYRDWKKPWGRGESDVVIWLRERVAS